ncbi:putative holin-like toxin [Weissella thailandensis]|uniref:Holin-like toxin n=1 Tax=Weissella thailandensis TaxID=89061 RepID=A0ABX9I606_9LACO|nr:putative holin-like toxin [Weissella thailandensis]RDS59932.1 putative holin-like toxin [Weissella thailandensis]
MTILKPDSKERGSWVSISDALQLMLMFGTFIVSLITLVVELIKISKKK